MTQPPPGRRRTSAARLAWLLALTAPALVLPQLWATAPASAAVGPWSGSTTSPPSSPAAVPDSLTAVSCQSSGTCLAVGTYGFSSTRGLLLSESGGNWSAAQAPMPTGAPGAQDVGLSGVSCTSSGSCEVVGGYGGNDGVLLSETSGVWTATTAPVPSTAEPGDAQPQIYQVSCFSTGNCAAEGIYLAGNPYGYTRMLLSEASGSWSVVNAPAPSGGTIEAIYGLSCGAAGSCVAVGNYEDSSGHSQALMITLASGTWTAAKLTLPANAASSPGAYLTSVSCTSATSCEAIGIYLDTSGNTDPMVVADSSGTWTATEAQLPAGAATTGQDVTLSDVSCPAAGDCEGVGTYLDSSGRTEGLLLNQSSGAWSSSEAPLPAGAASGGQDVQLSSVSCSAVGSCAAGGEYVDGAAVSEGMILALSSGSWSAIEEPVFSGEPAEPHSGVVGVACSTAGNCAAVGDYETSSGDQDTVLSETSGTWSIVPAPMPPGMLTSPSAGLDSVSCPGATSCVAVGNYVDSSGGTDPLIMSGSGASWTASQAPVPSGASDPDYSEVQDVACSSTTSCVAVGWYYGTSGGPLGLLLADTSGTWSASELTLPANANAFSNVDFGGVSCVSSGYCVATATYNDTSGNQEGVLVTYTGGSWSTGLEAPLPTGAATSGQTVNLGGVACTSATSCVVAGSYVNGSSNTEPLILTLGTGSWSASGATLPSGASSYQSVTLGPLACSSSSSCVAVGTYYAGAAFDLEGLVLTDSSGTWTPSEAPLPSGAASNPEVNLDALSCTTVGNCVAGGDYENTSDASLGVLLTDTSGSWSASKAPTPSAAATNPTVTIGSISCYSTGNCAATGGYYDTSGNQQGLLLTDTSGSWGATQGPLPAPQSTNPGMILSQVTCQTAGSCNAVGTYSDGNGGTDALFETAEASTCSGATAAAGCGMPVSIAVTPGTLSLESSPQLYWRVVLDGYDQWESASKSALSSCSSSGGGTNCSGATSPSLEVVDATGSGSGWSLSAYLSGADLPAGAALDFDGAGIASGQSLNHPLASLPVAAQPPGTVCDYGSACTPASPSTACSHIALGITSCPSYPVSLTAASSVSTQADLYSASISSAIGAICFASGSATASGCAGTSDDGYFDLGLPANAPAGSFGTTVITLTVSSGP